ncbi:type IV secretion system protein VirB4 [Palleronia aestuarii]|uniref:Type IV secretion system protein VirB4 n=1 Tax=Palleronia aestuarii TaxID=568105 RepID=A0A2W7NSE8_9RHOB|nr:hypothetical protein [Palleronia aestuarii]PZX14182.1 type IV secretion system protein VirB4 [Palleronia aestuarii]
MLDVKQGLGRRAVDPPGLKREHMLASYLPYVTGVGEDVLMLRDGDVMASFLVSGIEADTADATFVADVARAFGSTVAQARPDIAFYVHRISHETAPILLPVEGDGLAARIDAQWQGLISGGGLRERVSMVSVVVRARKLAGLLARITGGSKRDLRAERTRRIAVLNEVTTNLMQAVTPTRPERLTLADGRWLGLLRTAVTGKYAPLTPGVAFTPIGNLLVDSRVDFRGDSFVVLGSDEDDMRFGAMFTFKKYPTETAPGFLDRLDLPGDTIVTHSFTPIDLVPALGRVQRTIRQMSAADDAARSAQAQLVDAADDLASGRISFGQHQVSIMAVARSPEELNDLASEIRTQSQRALAVAVREDIGARTAYFAQHPGNFTFRARDAMISSACFADFAALHTTGRGLEPGTEPWGAPITILPTLGGEPYRFSFHQPGEPGDRTVGHTLVIGRTGSGKTLGTAFLLAQAQRLGPRIIAFDKDRGLESAIRGLGGSYSAVQMGVPTGFNPFRSEADLRGVGWLTDWLGALLTADAPPLTAAQEEALSNAVRANADSDPYLQTLSAFRSQLVSVDDGGDLHTRMGQWDDGKYHWLFSGKEGDPLRFSNRITAFDLTEIFDSPAVRTAWLSYVFRRIERTVEDGRPTIIVLDEAWKMLDDPYFQARLKDWMLTMRKKNVVVVMLTQRVSHIAESAAGGSIFESCVTQILFPSSKNTSRELAPLNLTDREEEFLCTSAAGARTALVRANDASTIVDLDLSVLGPMLRALGAGRVADDSGDDDKDNEPLPFKEAV